MINTFIHFFFSFTPISYGFMIFLSIGVATVIDRSFTSSPPTKIDTYRRDTKGRFLAKPVIYYTDLRHDIGLENI